MVHAADLHTVFSELHVGSLTLAALAIAGLAIHAVHGRFLSGRWARLDGMISPIPRYADPVAYVGAVFGILGFIGSIATGSFTWRPEALLGSAEVLNKVMVSVVALELWILFAGIRYRFGTRVVERPRLRVVYIAIGVVAFGLTTVAASLGGHLVGKHSLLDPIYSALGIQTSTPWVVPPFSTLVEAAYASSPLLGLAPREFFVVLFLLDILAISAFLLVLVPILRKRSAAVHPGNP